MMVQTRPCSHLGAACRRLDHPVLSRSLITAFPPVSLLLYSHRLFSSKLSARVAAAARSPSSALMTRLLAEAEGGVRGDEYTLRLAGEAVRATQRGLIGNGGSGGAGGGEDGDDEDCAMFAYGEGPLPVVRGFGILGISDVKRPIKNV